MIDDVICQSRTHSDVFHPLVWRLFLSNKDEINKFENDLAKKIPRLEAVNKNRSILQRVR